MFNLDSIKHIYISKKTDMFSKNTLNKLNMYLKIYNINKKPKYILTDTNYVLYTHVVYDNDEYISFCIDDT